MSSQLLNLSKESFDEYINENSGVVLLDIWADWCGPCKQLTPVLEEIAEVYAADVKVYKVNADQQKEIMARFNVRGLPTMIVFVNGQEQNRLLGVLPKARITQTLEQYL